MRRAIVRSSFACLIALLLVVGMAFGPLAAAAPAMVNMNLKGADVAEVFRALGEVGGLNIVLDPAVKGTLTVKLQDVTVDEALQLVAYATGVQYRVVGPSLIVTPKGAVSGLETPVTEKLSLRYARTDDVAPALAMAAPNTRLQPDVRTNSFVAQGPAEEIEILRTVLSMLDVPIAPPEASQPAAEPEPVPTPVESVRIVQLKHAPAARVADVLKVMLDRAKIQADERTNSIVFLADDDAWVRAQGIVAGLDVAVEEPAEAVLASPAPTSTAVVSGAPVSIVSAQPPAEADALKVLKLTWAPAVQIRTALSAVVSDVRMSADERTNSLVAIGPTEQLARVEEIVSLLDVAVPPAPSPDAAQPVEEYIDMIELSHADPIEVRQAISAVIPADKVIADARSASVIVIGTSLQHERARQIAAFMDRAKPAEAAEAAAPQGMAAQPQAGASPSSEPAPAPAVKSVKAYRLTYAEPESVRKALSLVVPANALEVDTRTRSVIMLGLPDDHAIAADIVAMLDIELPAPVSAETALTPAAPSAEEPQPAVAGPRTTVVRLAYASAAAVRDSLVYLVPELKVSADARTNSLILIGSDEAVERAQGLIGELDIAVAKEDPAPPELEAAEVVRLKYASPMPVKDALAVTMPSSKISVDERTGSLVIVGTAAQRAAVREVIAQLDVELATQAPEPETVAEAPEPVAGPETSIVRLQNASAAAMRESILSIVPELKVTADARTNSLVLLGPEEAIRRAKGLISELDVAVAAPPTPEEAPVEPETHIVRLSYASAARVRENLAALVPELKVSSDERTNALIVIGSERDVAQARALITELDIAVGEAEPIEAPAPPEVETAEVIRLAYASPVAVRDALAPTIPASKISVDERTGSVVIVGTSAQREVAKGIIAKLDIVVAQPAATAVADARPEAEELHVVMLKHASAAQVKQALAPVVPLSNVTVDERTNSVIMVATESRAARALAVIDKLDVPIAESTAGTAQASAIIAEAPVVEQPMVMTHAVKNADAAGLKPAVGLLVQSANIQIDARTNTLVVLAEPSVQRRVAELVASLDVPLPAPPAAPQPEPDAMRVFKLAHAAASDMKALISSVVPASTIQADDRTGSLVVIAGASALARAEELIKALDLPSAPEPEAPEAPPADPQVARVYRLNYANPSDMAAVLSGFVTGKISPDARTSSVAVMAPQSQHAQVLELIEALDTALPQVLIEARLEELSGDAGKKLGLDWSFGGISLGHNSLGQIVDVSIDILANLSILEEKGEASLISRQHTFTVDGKTGKILIGDRIPVLVQEVRDGQVVNRVDFINAGVELSITPKVSNDGTITASVKPVISSIVGWTPQNYPQIRTRELETIVSLTSGQTAVIGGLLHKDEIESIAKIPLLGDIPLLGELFKHKTSTEVDTEVVMLITAWQVNPDQRTVVGPAKPGDAFPVTIEPTESAVPVAK